MNLSYEKGRTRCSKPVTLSMSPSPVDDIPRSDRRENAGQRAVCGAGRDGRRQSPDPTDASSCLRINRKVRKKAAGPCCSSELGREEQSGHINTIASTAQPGTLSLSLSLPLIHRQSVSHVGPTPRSPEPSDDAERTAAVILLSSEPYQIPTHAVASPVCSRPPFGRGRPRRR